MRYIYWETAKIALPWRLRPQPPCLQTSLGVLPPASGSCGLCSQTPMISGGWELCLQTPVITPPPIVNSWLRHWGEELKILKSDREKLGKNVEKHCFRCSFQILTIIKWQTSKPSSSVELGMQMRCIPLANISLLKFIRFGKFLGKFE